MSCRQNAMLVYGVLVDPTGESAVTQFLEFVRRHTGKDGYGWLEDRGFDATMAGHWERGTFGCVLVLQCFGETSGIIEIDKKELDDTKWTVGTPEAQERLEVFEMAERFAPAYAKWGYFLIARYI